MKYVGRITLSILLAMNALVLLFGCGQGFSPDSIPAPSGRISSITNDYPGVVMVLMPEGAGMCSGSVISSRAVLTAAHCLEGDGIYTIETSFGTFDTSTKQALGSGSVADTTDLGVLVFDKDITTDPDAIYPIASSANQGDAVTLVGFGCDSVANRTGAGVKRAGDNRIAQKSDFLYLLTPMSSSRIIGDAAQSGTCFGDSGGPLFKKVGSKLEIAGVTHAGGTVNGMYVSEFTDLDNSANRDFLGQMSKTYALNVVF